MPNLESGVWYKKADDTIVIGIDNINPITGSEKWSKNIIKRLKSVFIKFPNEKKIVITHYPISDFSFESDIHKPYLSH